MMKNPNKKQTKTKFQAFLGAWSLELGIFSVNPRRGFTLIETLVAITVLLLAVAAPLTLGSQGLTASRVARDQVVATYLIQEGVEFIRNVRDTNVLQGNDWLANISGCMTATCTVDISLGFPPGSIGQCTGGVCPVLRFNEETGLYGYNENETWVETKFTRSLRLTEVSSAREALVVVTVSWRDGLISRSISVNEHIFNWP